MIFVGRCSLSLFLSSFLLFRYWSVVQQGLKLEASFVDTSGAQAAAAAQASRLLDSAAGLGAAAAALLFVSMFDGRQDGAHRRGLGPVDAWRDGNRDPG